MTDNPLRAIGGMFGFIINQRLLTDDPVQYGIEQVAKKTWVEIVVVVDTQFDQQVLLKYIEKLELAIQLGLKRLAPLLQP
ncbi:hypothetical protein D3C77_290520 [compost metagenome]